MFLSKKTPLIAIDMGSHSIKLLQLAQLKNRNFELVSLGIMPLEQGSIVEGAIKDPDQVAEALKNLVKARKNSIKLCRCFCFGRSGICKKNKST